MKAFVVGTAGHVDHGKTALVRALTGVETDRWREEKERGLTIDLGFAPLRVDGELEVGIVDVPGHEDFVTNMLAGATGLDLLLLVVAADEGPMPQTREHLTIAHLLGVDEGVVAVTKADRVDAEWLELVREAVRDELRTVLGHAAWPVHAVSSTEGTGIEELRSEIGSRAERIRERPARDHFRLPVDRSFTVRGAGTVVTGTAWSGSLAVGDHVRILPGELEARVRSLQVHGHDRDRVAAGRRCAAALAGVDPEEAPRGAVLVTGEGWRAVDRVGARIRLPPYVERGVEDGQRVRVYLGTREVMARAELTREMAVPGEAFRARLFLEDPLVARARDRFVLRFYSPVVTIGGGQVAALEPGPGWAARGDLWDRVLEGDPGPAMEAAVRLAGGRGLPAGDVFLATGLTVEEVEEVEAAPPPGLLRIQGRWFRGELVEEARERLLEDLAGMHREDRRSRGASLEALRSRAARSFAGPLVERAVGELAEAGEVEVEGPRIRLPGHEPTLTEEEAGTRDAILDRVEAGGLEPDTVQELAEGLDVGDDLLHDLLELLTEEGRLVAVTAEIYLTPESERRLREGARRVLEQGPLPAPVQAFKEAFGVSRKYLIPYMEHLDGLGITRRTGDGRVPGSAAAGG